MSAVVPSTRIVAAGGKTPAIAEGCFVAPNASLIGDVNIGEGSSVWYGAVLKGDDSPFLRSSGSRR